MYTDFAPAISADERTARRSSSVMPEGTPTTTRGFIRNTRREVTRLRKWRSIISVMSTSAITPSFSGRIASMSPGVRPSMRFASRPIPRILRDSFSTATTQGSLTTTPSPRTYTSVFAVPRSTAMSCTGTRLRRGLNQLVEASTPTVFFSGS